MYFNESAKLKLRDKASADILARESSYVE